MITTKSFAEPYRLSDGELAHMRAIIYYEQLSPEDKKRADKYCTPLRAAGIDLEEKHD